VKQICLDSTNLQDCVSGAQSELIVLTNHGQPVAMVVGVEGMDQEQIDFGRSARFWNLIQERRKASSIGRAELEAKLTECGN
jgi:hypothetical protein